VLIPAFAVERSQEMLADILTLMEEGQVPRGEVFLDSPLAIEATEVFLQRGWNRDTGTNPFEDLRAGERLKFMRSAAQSDTLERLRGWHIVMAASGMCDAGRVRKHLKRLLWRRDATVLLSGYQASGTLGRILQSGAAQVSIQGEPIQVRARIRSLDCYSAHADATGLVAWAKARTPVAGEVFILHGEPSARTGLRERLAAAGLAVDRIAAPEMDDGFILTRTSAAPATRVARRIAAEAVVAPDWHNVRARFLLELDERLRATPDDAARERLLAALQSDLAGAARPDNVGDARPATHGDRALESAS
jgi:metallo-beta-lactamase family protein